MNHQVFGRKLHRNTKLRAQLFKMLVYNFVMNDKLVTTDGRAKAVRPFLEKLITKAKKGEAQRRLLLKEVNSKKFVDMLLLKAKRFENTNGGYTRLIKMETRLGDNGKQMLMLWSKEAVSEVKNPVARKEIAASEKTEKVVNKTKAVKSKK